MKKIAIVLSVILVLTALFSALVFAEENQLQVVINGIKVNFPDAQPFIDENGRAQAPVRFMCEALGANVEWEASTKTAIITVGSDIIKFVIGEKQYLLNGNYKQMDTAPMSKDGRTYVPIRYVSEALGATVSWDADTKTIGITRVIKLPKRVALPANSNSFQVDNEYYKLGKHTPAELPEIIKNELYIPIKPLAVIFNGTYSYDTSTNQAALKIDNTLFEFKIYDSAVKINGKQISMSCEAHIQEDIVKVPASIFVNNLDSYEVKLYSTTAMVFKEKGALDLYDDIGKIIGEANLYDIGLTWEERLNKYGKEVAEAVMSKVDKIVSEISTPGMNDYEKALAVNRYIVENVKYDYTYKAASYDALLKGTAVCEGFTLAAGLLLSKMDVESLYVVGYAGIDGLKGDIDEYELCNYAGNRHAWNIVKIEGKYYHLDTTWNQGSINGEHTNKLIYSYFLLSDKQIDHDHIWWKSLYPECKDDFDPELMKALEEKGYSIISGKIHLEDNSTAQEDMYIIMGINSNEGSGIASSRVIKLEKGKTEAAFLFAPEKSFDINKLHIGFQSANWYNYKPSEPYTISYSANGQSYDVVVSITKTAKLRTKIVLPGAAKAEQSFTFRITTMTPSGKGYSFFGNDTESVTVSKGMTEAYIDFNVPVPEGDYWYEVRCIGDSNDSFIDEKGNFATSSIKLNASQYPLKQLEIKIPEAIMLEPQVEKDTRAELSSSDLEELKAKLIEFHIGDNDNLKNLKTTKDAMELEKSEPVETESNGTIYYSETLSSGVQIWRSYNHADDPENLYYSITLNNVKISEENYQEIFEIFNDYLKEMVGAEAINKPRAYSHGEGYKDIAAFDSKELFTKIINGNARINVKYQIDNIQYYLVIGGYASTQKAVLGIDIIIHK